MNSLVSGAADGGFFAPLYGARRLYLLRMAGIAALWAMAGALVVLRAGPQFVPATDWRVGAMVFGLAVLAAGLAAGLRAAPGLDRLAAAADRRFALGERLSTAVGLPSGSGEGWAGLLANQLRRDAAGRAAGLSARRLQPLAGRGVVLAGLVFLAALAVFFVPQDRAPAPTAPVTASAPADASARAQNLLTIAEVIRADAAMRQNDYLKAVADAVEKLAQTPDAAMSDSQFNEALTGLLDHARLAYGRIQPGWLRGDAAAGNDPFHLERDRTFANLAGAAHGQADDGKAGGGEEMIPETFGEQGLLPDHAGQPAAGALRPPPDQVGDLSISNQSVGGNADAPTGGAKTAGPSGSAPSLGNTDPGDVDVTGASGMPLGAAAQSGAGASRVAGSGTQGVDAPQRAEAAPIAADDQVMLPSDSYQPGKRIRIQIVPRSGDGEASGVGEGQAITAEGVRAPVARDLPSVHDQSAFARYFTHNETF